MYLPSNLFRFWTLFIISILFSNPISGQQYGYNSFALAPKGLQAISFFWEHQGLNVNPAGILFKRADLNTDAFNLSYSYYFSLAGKTAQVNVAIPYVFVDASTSVGEFPLTANPSGFADPYAHFAMALIGGNAIEPEDFIKYNGGLTLHGLFAIRVPIGTYDEKVALNSGQNRFEFRFGLPLVKSWGSPGNSTALEFYPVVALYTANNDGVGGSRLTQKPLYRFELHGTKDILSGLLSVGADLNYIIGGETATDGIKADNEQAYLAGGFHVSGRFSRQFGWGAIFSYPISSNDNVNKAIWSRININYSF